MKEQRVNGSTGDIVPVSGLWISERSHKRRQFLEGGKLPPDEDGLKTSWQLLVSL